MTIDLSIANYDVFSRAFAARVAAAVSRVQWGSQMNISNDFQTPGAFWIPPQSPSVSRAAGTHGIGASDRSIPDPRNWLAAIVEGSGDAIISKDLRGVIQSWNPGAERLFGYDGGEIVGKPVTILIPADRLEEEPRILAEIQRGRRVDTFETRRVRKDGTLVDISLTVSPIHNAEGIVIGASKIARDISERRAAQEQQQLLLGEMRHRVKNLFALASAIVSLSARSHGSREDIFGIIQQRLEALARAHELTMANAGDRPGAATRADLMALIEAILAPYTDADRIVVEGDAFELQGKAVTHIALLLHELATNAAKYGSLSCDGGRLFVRVGVDSAHARITWDEICTGPPLDADAAKRTGGFGTRLEQGVANTLRAEIERDWRPAGLFVRITIPRTVLMGE